MTYEELFYRSYSIKELQEIVNNTDYLETFRQRCNEELQSRAWR
jgi:hypothetical protein